MMQESTSPAPTTTTNSMMQDDDSQPSNSQQQEQEHEQQQEQFDQLLGVIQANIESLSRVITNTESRYLQKYYFTDDSDEEFIKKIPFEDIYEGSDGTLRSINDDILDAENALIGVCVALDDLSGEKETIQPSTFVQLPLIKCSLGSCFTSAEIIALEEKLNKNESVKAFVYAKISQFTQMLIDNFKTQSDALTTRFQIAESRHNEYVAEKKKERAFLKESEIEEEEDDSNSSEPMESYDHVTIDRKIRKIRRRPKKKENGEVDGLLDKISNLHLDFSAHKRKQDELEEEVGTVFDKNKRMKRSEEDEDSTIAKVKNKCHIWSREVTWRDLRGMVDSRENEAKDLEELIKTDETYTSELEEKRESLGYLQAIMDEVRLLPNKRIKMWYWSRDNTDKAQDIGPFITEEDCRTHYNEYINSIDILLSEHLKL